MLDLILLLVVIISGIVLLVDYFFMAKKRMENMQFITLCEFAFVAAIIFLLLDAYNFEFVLTMSVIVTGFIYLADALYFKKRRLARHEAMQVGEEKLTPKQEAYLEKEHTYIEYSRSFFPVLLIVLVLRSFSYEPFRIPSGSLEPTLLVGDFILVNKYDYGIRVPVLNNKVISIHSPKRGDIAVMHWPVNEKYDFIKRVIGLPGDHVAYKDKVLYINGKKAEQTLQKTITKSLGNGRQIEVQRKTENLNGVKHDIYVMPSVPAHDFNDIVVPKGMYFVMGDNRDDSEDSRYWGFVSDQQIVGKAVAVLLSWDGQTNKLRWDRFGSEIKGGK